MSAPKHTPTTRAEWLARPVPAATTTYADDPRFRDALNTVLDEVDTPESED